MKRMRWMLGPVAALLLGVPSAAMAEPGDLVGQAAPDFALKDTTGRNLRLSEYRGDVVLVTFVAEWCGRCTLQLDRLADLNRRYAGRGVQFLAVSLDPADAASRDAALRLGFPVLRDRNQAVARQYNPADLPLALVLDPGGRVRHVHEKYRDGDAETYAAQLDALLAE